MNGYHVGDRLVLGERAGPLVAGRVEAMRPDGTRVARDWDKGPWKLKLDQPGTWIWRLFTHDDAGTRLEQGEIEVLPATRPHGLLDRLLRRS